MARRTPNKVKLAYYGNVNKAALVEEGATVGATIGQNLYLENGELATIAALTLLIQTNSSDAGGGTIPLARTIWRLISEIPANVLQVAALATSGLVVRQASGDWETRSIAVADVARLTVTNADGDAGAPTLDMADIAAASVWGRAANTVGKPAPIASAGDDTVVRRTASTINFGQLTLGMAPNSLWTYAKIQDAAAVSVLGRSANSIGVLADIVAGANDRLLTRVANALAFTQLTAGMFPNAVVPDAALSSNVALLNRDPQTFAGATIFSKLGTASTPTLQLASNVPILEWNELDAAADNRRWQMFQSGESFVLRTINDASNAAANAILIDRTGVTVDSIALTATTISLNGVASTDFARLSQSNTFTYAASSGVWPIMISGSLPGFMLSQTGAAADSKHWREYVSGTTRVFGVLNDALNAAAVYMLVDRTALTIDSVVLSGTIVAVSSKDFTVGSSAAINAAANRGIVTVNGVTNAIFQLATGGTRRGYVFHTGVGGSIQIVNEEVGNLDIALAGGLWLTMVSTGGTQFMAAASTTVPPIRVGTTTATGVACDISIVRAGATRMHHYNSADGIEMMQGASAAVGYIGTRSAHPFTIFVGNATQLSISTAGVMTNGAGLVYSNQESGSFTGTLTGMSGATTGTINWERTGRKVTLRAAAAISGTSNATTMTMTGLPAAIQPASAQWYVCGPFRDDIGVDSIGVAKFAAASGTVTFNRLAISGTNVYTNGNWNNPGAKGISAAWAVTYDLG